MIHRLLRIPRADFMIFSPWDFFCFEKDVNNINNLSN